MWKKQACRQAGISVQRFAETNLPGRLHAGADGLYALSRKSGAFSSNLDDYVKMLLFNPHD